MNDLVQKNAKYPYIIALGQDNSTILKYFIEFEKHLFDVRLNLIPFDALKTCLN